MNSGQTVFAQIMDYLPKKQFATCVRRYQGEHKVKTFTVPPYTRFEHYSIVV